ncbi:hypothetical protein OG599_00245 [Streptomyces sp. NBC_01335]|uniref:hypothetical protein n=1 Tax=Streptomyces sp. NBC_01335 TaxID=2903828 RepID=UPI002E11FD85|nr:hypothetical protein OG599_00245 [Streptomyces sp. NBC_01335]
MAFTVRLAAGGHVRVSGSRTDSAGIRRDVIQRTDHMDECPYGSAVTGGFGVAAFACRVGQSAGDVTAAIHQRPVETGRIHPGACVTRWGMRTWRSC